MASDPVEVLTVQLEADYDKLVRQTKEGVDKSEKELDRLSDAPKKATSAWQQFGGFLSGQFLGIITTLGAAIAAAFSVQAVVNFFGAITKGMVDTNSQFETFRVQFETLLGSRGEATKRIEELAQFGVETPYELDQIVEANRLLQTFGGTLLATGENLRRIGDSAAAVNANFQEVSFWTGRLYSSIQAGRPFGEASARLQELGILSGDVRTKLEDMQKAGKNGTEIWAAYAEMVDTRFSGAMERLSKTLQGVMSNLADFQSMLLREGGEELFEGIREDVIEFYDIISNPEASDALINLSKAVGGIANSLRDLITSPILETLKNIDPKDIDDLASSFQDIGDALGDLGGGGGGNLNLLIDAISGLNESIAITIALFGRLQEAAGAISGPLANLRDIGVDLTDVFLSMLAPSSALVATFQDLLMVDKVNDAFKATTDLSVSEWIRGVDKSARDLAEEYAHVGTEAENASTAIAGSGEAAQEAAPDLDKLKDILEDIQEHQEDMAEKREEIEEEHGDRLAEITEDYTERQAEIIEEAGESLVELEQEIADRREEIAQETAEALADLAEETAEAQSDAMEQAASDIAGLESETQDEIASIQADAQQEEQRALEDHQREMRRLHDNYILDLEGAVKNRDARAIVDARRKYQQDRREAEEDFQTQSRRRREDTEQAIEEAKEREEKKRREIEEKLQEQLEDIAENEAEKRQEIEESQQEQLAKLQEFEAEKKAEIEAKRQEEMEEAEAARQEQLEAEAKHYTDELLALEESNQRWMEEQAKRWAEDEALTREGLAATLAAAEEVLGPNGSYEQMMQEFIDRQRENAETLAEINSQLMNPPSPTAGGGPDTMGGTGGGDTPIPLPAFQEGGIVPGIKGTKRLIVAHAGEMIVPENQIGKILDKQQGAMAASFADKPLVVEVRVSGSAPPGIEGAQIDQIAGVIVSAFQKAGIGARQKR